jgi:hypothetical protein
MASWSSLRAASVLHARHFHTGHAAGEAGLAHGLEHLPHLSVLAEQVVDFLHAGAGAAGDALAAAAVDGFVMLAFVTRHGVDDGFDAIEFFLINVVGSLLHVGEGADLGHHSHDALDGAELLDLAQLIAEIFEREAFVAHRLGSEGLGLFLVEGGIGLFDKREDVAHAEDASDDAVGVEGLEGFVFFADTDELDGLAGDVTDGECGAAAGVAVHLGEHNAGESELLVELVGGADRVLSGHGVGDEEDLLRVQDLLQRLHFVHELLVDVQTAGGVNDEYVTAVADGVASGFLHQALDVGGVGLADFSFVEMGLDGMGDDFELLARGGTIDVNRDEHGTVSTLLEPVGEFAGGRGLAGTLQASHEDDGGRLRSELELGGVFAEDGDQLAVNDLDDLLGGRERSHDFLAERLLADVLDELLDDVEVNVGFEQRHADFFERVADVFFGEGTLAAEVFESALELICKILKHLGHVCGGVGAGREVSG